MEFVKVSLAEIKRYKNNPRFNSDSAVEAVKESIKQTEYISPIVLDENNEILAGHTRYQALYELGYDEVDVIRVEGLTSQQKRKFRLLDNRTAEIATWDLDRLQEELDGLNFGDFDFWSKELEKMGTKAIVDNDDEKKVIICPRCGKVVSGLVDADLLEE